MNEVASNFTTNGIIAISASQSISNMPDEAEESGRNVDAVILNAGTLSQERARAMLLAGESANHANVPVLFDPIAVGATRFRTSVIYDVLDNVALTSICDNSGKNTVLSGSLE